MSDTPSADSEHKDSASNQFEGAARMAVDLDGMRRLHQLHAMLATETDLEAALAEIVTVACEFTGTDHGCIQLVSDDGTRLEMIAWHGYADDGPFISMFRHKGLKGCDVVRVGQNRMLVEDWTTTPGLAPAFYAMLDAEGIAASQSTPLISSKGATLGVLSTQFRQPHHPSDDELRLVDLLALTATDFIERFGADKSSREHQIWLADQSEALQAAIDDAPLETSLGVLVRTMTEHLGRETRAAFYLVGRDGGSLHHVVGMSAAYAEAVDGFAIGPDLLAYGLATHSGQPLLTADVRKEPRWQPWLWMAERFDYRGCWSFPIHTAAGRFVGTLAVYSRQPREATSRDTELANLITRTAAIIISRHVEGAERRRSERALHESDERQTFLLKLSDTLRPLTSTEAIQCETCRLLGKALGVDRAYYVEVDEDRDEVCVAQNFLRGDSPSLEGTHRAADYGWALEAMRHGEITVVNDAQHAERIPEADRHAMAAARIAAYANVPLLKDGRLVGALCVTECVPRQWTDAEIELLREAAERIWATIERARAETAARESEARQAFLLKLSDALRPLSDPLAIQEATSRAVQEHMNVDWARYSELDFERQIIFNTRDFGQNGRPSHVDEYDMRQFPVHAAAWRAGRSVAIDDVAADTILSSGERNRLLKHGIHAMLATPLAKNTMTVAVISAHSTVPRRWTDGDVALLEEAADRTWEALERAHAETAQWESEARYRHLFETIPVGFGVVEVIRDEEGKVVDWFVREFNPALERHVGLDCATTVGQRIRDVLTEAGLDGSLALFQDVVDNRQSRHSEICTDGIDRWLAITASPLDGDRISLIFEDITDRRQAEQAQREREDRQAFLLKLGDALRAEFDPEAIGVLATNMLAEYMRVDRSYICRLSRDRNRVWIGPEYHAPGVASVAGEYRLDDFPASMRQLETEPLVIHDLLNDPNCSDLDRQSIGAMGMQAVFTGMLRKGERNHVWALVVGHSRPRIWTDGDRMLVQAAAERTWTAVARARVEVVMHENEARYRSVVESATDGIWLADRDGRFIEVNAAGCRMLGYSPDQYRQLGIRDLIQPDEEPRLRTLVETLEQGGQSTDTWRIRHADGHYVPIESSQCFTPAGYWQIIGRDVSERQRVECELQQRSEQFVTLLRESPMGVYLIDSKLRIRVINPAAREAAGGGIDLAGYDFDSAMHDVWSHDFADELVWRVRQTLATGESYFTPERSERRGGDIAWYAWHIHRTAIPGDGDGVVCYLSDVTNQVRARERQKLLLMEVNHRVKNTLATVQSIVAQSLRNASTLEEGAAALESRLISLSSAHNVLVREHWEGGDLHEVVRNTLAAYPDKAGASRFRVSGTGVRLQPKAVVTLSMALHELATNAVKYGALSKAHGYVDIAWEVDDGRTSDRRFRLRWSEHDGPPVNAPKNRGFGSRLIERGLAMDMGGEAHLDFDPEGLVCTIDAPLNEISGEARWGEG